MKLRSCLMVLLVAKASSLPVSVESVPAKTRIYPSYSNLLVKNITPDSVFLHHAEGLKDCLVSLQQVPRDDLNKVSPKANLLDAGVTKRTAKALLCPKKQDEKVNHKLSKINSVVVHKSILRLLKSSVAPSITGKGISCENNIACPGMTLYSSEQIPLYFYEVGTYFLNKRLINRATYNKTKYNY